VTHDSDFRVEQAEILAGVDGLAALGQELRSHCNLGGATSSLSRFHRFHSEQDAELRVSKETVLFHVSTSGAHGHIQMNNGSP
jgi:hypothetical protein